MAKTFNLSTGTVHFRAENMMCAVSLVLLLNVLKISSLLTQLESLEEVVEAYYTTEHCSIFIKVMTHSIDALQQVLINKIQTIDEIQSTETLIPLQNPIMCNIVP